MVMLSVFAHSIKSIEIFENSETSEKQKRIRMHASVLVYLRDMYIHISSQGVQVSVVRAMSWEGGFAGPHVAPPPLAPCIAPPRALCRNSSIPRALCIVLAYSFPPSDTDSSVVISYLLSPSPLRAILFPPLDSEPFSPMVGTLSELTLRLILSDSGFLWAPNAPRVGRWGRERSFMTALCQFE